MNRLPIKLTATCLAAALASCSSVPPQATHERLNRTLESALETRETPVPQQEVQTALLPPLHIELPRSPEPTEERFNLTAVDLPAQELFMALATDTDYTLLVHPDLQGRITAELKNVTLPQALQLLQQVHDLDYAIDGKRVVVRPGGLHTRVFQVNYLMGQRRGESTTRVTSASMSATRPAGAAAQAPGAPGAPASAAASAAPVATDVVTRTESDFWRELEDALKAIVGDEAGRSVVVNRQSGVVVVRARQKELDGVGAFMRATQQSVDRQVILEAKILEVQLKDEYQAGVNWAAFSSSPQVSLGFGAPGATLAPRGVTPILSAGGVSAAPGSTLNISPNAPGALFGMAVQANRFAALLSFLETQGSVHVLSSPRIATMNNQKAVLKVGTEDYFVTDLKPGTFTTVGTQVLQQPPSVTLQPFFSGVVLDVTPQVDAQGLVRLHMRPSVSEASTVEKSINLGDSSGTLTLPLASTSASETDSMVLARDGQVVVVGGLMRQSSNSNNANVPGVGSLPLVGSLFRQTGRTALKRELVILLRPRVIESDEDWTADLQRTQSRVRELPARPSPVDPQR